MRARGSHFGWSQPAKINCLGFISSPRRLPGNADTGSEKYSRIVNVVFDENCMSFLVGARKNAVAIRACKDKDAGEDRFVDYGKCYIFNKSAIFMFDLLQIV